MTRNADLQISASLKDGSSDWLVMKPFWFGKEARLCVLGWFIMEQDLTIEICYYSKSV